MLLTKKISKNINNEKITCELKLNKDLVNSSLIGKHVVIIREIKGALKIS